MHQFTYVACFVWNAHAPHGHDTLRILKVISGNGKGMIRKKKFSLWWKEQ